jgi:hypothetical protein
MSYIHCITTEILSVGLPTYVALAQFLFKKKKKELLPGLRLSDPALGAPFGRQIAAASARKPQLVTGQRQPLG